MWICLNVDPAIHAFVATQSHNGSWIILITGSATYEGIFWLSYFPLLVMGMCDWMQKNSPNGGVTAVRPICHKMTSSLWAVGLRFLMQFSRQGQKLHLSFVHFFIGLLPSCFVVSTLQSLHPSDPGSLLEPEHLAFLR